MIKGWKKLNKEERRHVSHDAGCLSTAAWQLNTEFQRETREKTGKPACWTCWMINVKLQGTKQMKQTTDQQTKQNRTVTRTERGWAGHFCAAASCLFRRNTLLECGKIKIVVSTVGLMQNSLYGRKDLQYSALAKNRFDTIGLDRYYETMAFHANPKDARYHDIDVTRQVKFESQWSIGTLDADDKANLMHEAVVEEISQKMSKGVRL